LRDILTQFIAAFDDVVINRYDNDRNVKEKIEVRYVLAGKQRVMFDVVNQSQNITLPVVAIDIKSLSRDASRVHHKLGDVMLPHSKTENYQSLTKFGMPIPVNLEISMSIMARYMLDVQQIISNFVPYVNPYLIISWKVPSTLGPDYDVELRSEVLWNGDISFNNPVDIGASDKIRFVADTSFTIKGWLFKTPQTPVQPIFFIDANFHAVNNKILNYNSYYSLSAADLQTESIHISAFPDISNIFICTSAIQFPVTNSYDLNTWTYLLDENGDYLLTESGEKMIVDLLSITYLVAENGMYIQDEQGNYIITDITQEYESVPRETFVLKNTLTRQNNLILYGQYFNRTTHILLSADNDLFSSTLTLTSFNMKYTGDVSGYIVPTQYYRILSDSVIALSLPDIDGTGKFDIIVNNPAGWRSSYDVDQHHFEVT